MRILKEGDKSKAVCPKCKIVKATSYIYRDYLTDAGVKVSNVLQGVCDTCGTTATIPAQSVPKIQQYLQEKDVSLEVRVPPILEDVLYHIGYSSHLEAHVALKCLIHFYHQKISHESKLKTWESVISLKKNQSVLVSSKKSRISIRISKNMDNKIKEIGLQYSINKSECIIGILVKAKEDLIENKNEKEAKRFYDSVQLLAD